MAVHSAPALFPRHGDPMPSRRDEGGQASHRHRGQDGSGAPDDLPGITVTLLDGRVLFVATYGGGRGALYDPRTDRWAPIPETPPQMRAVVRLLDGRVLAVGGIHAAVYTAP